MEMRSTRWKEVLQLAAFLLFFALTVSLNLTCSHPDSPAVDPDCGSGRVSWDGKICYDLSNNKTLPSKCCGQ